MQLIQVSTTTDSVQFNYLAQGQKVASARTIGGAMELVLSELEVPETDRTVVYDGTGGVKDATMGVAFCSFLPRFVQDIDKVESVEIDQDEFTIKILIKVSYSSDVNVTIN